MTGTPLRLGFIADSDLGFDGRAYYYRTGEWHYIERLASLFDTVDICARVISLDQLDDKDRAKYVHTLNVPNASVHDVSASRKVNTMGSTWVGRQLIAYRKLRTLTTGWDFAFLMAPDWLALMGWVRSRRDGWPYAVCFRADWLGFARHRFPRSLWLRLFLPLYLRIVQSIESRLLHDATIRMTEGFALVDRYPALADSVLPTVTLRLPLDKFRRRTQTRLASPPRLLYVGSLIRRKGVDVILRALARLRAKGISAELDIAGDGPERASLEKLAEDLKIDSQVTFHGYLSNATDLLDLYYRSDVFVLSSYSEGFPRVIYEAMSQSLPVVATRVGGIPIMLEDEETALLVEPGDVPRLTAAIERILTDSSLRRHLSQHGYRFAYQVINSDPLERAVEAFRAELSKMTHSASDSAGRDVDAHSLSDL